MATLTRRRYTVFGVVSVLIGLGLWLVFPLILAPVGLTLGLIDGVRGGSLGYLGVLLNAFGLLIALLYVTRALG